MRGRKPQVQRADGVLRACPRAPGWLSKPARREWRRAVRALHERGLLTEEMLATVEHYCVAVGRVRESEAALQRDGAAIAVDGRVAAHPMIAVQTAAMREARLLAAELALTPHRQGIRGAAMTTASERDDWDGDIRLLA